MAALTDAGLADALIRKLPDIDPIYHEIAKGWAAGLLRPERKRL